MGDIFYVLSGCNFGIGHHFKLNQVPFVKNESKQYLEECDSRYLQNIFSKGLCQNVTKAK